MDLILWRHAEAEVDTSGHDDAARVLTSKGHRQAQKMAEWLDASLPDSCRILCSPALRTMQTAEALGSKFKIVPALAPGASVEQILAAAHWPDGREPVLIVGHQPSLGHVASLLLSGVMQDWTIRKANAWWFAQRQGNGAAGAKNGNGDQRPAAERELAGTAPVYLRAVMTPELVRK